MDKGEVLMSKRKILITLLAVLMIMFVMVNSSYAAGSFSASLTPSNSRVSKGSELKVTLKLSGINVDGGINAMTATLDYDSDENKLILNEENRLLSPSRTMTQVSSTSGVKAIKFRIWMEGYDADCFDGLTESVSVHLLFNSIKRKY